MKTSNNQEEKILKHIKKYNGNVLTHLIFLHDKYIFGITKTASYLPIENMRTNL